LRSSSCSGSSCTGVCACVPLLQTLLCSPTWQFWGVLQRSQASRATEQPRRYHDALGTGRAGRRWR
jgi:hypothetical protein